jgi:hypothetical protein
VRSRALLLALLGALSCEAQAPRASPEVATPTTGDACEAQRSLDALDRRAPVPLLAPMAAHQKENMRDHLLAVQEIVSATAAADFDAVERSASRIGLSDEMHRMCSHMGQGAPGFTEQALNFHTTAESIEEAARAKDATAVMRALGETLTTCNGCHGSYRQEIVGALP